MAADMLKPRASCWKVSSSLGTTLGTSLSNPRSGIPGGLFDPSLSVGAGIGQTFQPLLIDIFPELEPASIIMLFMVAYFSGVVQSPITCAVIMVEMTAARFMTIPLLAVAIIAYECSHRICPTAIYEGLAEIFLGALEGKNASFGKKK